MRLIVASCLFLVTLLTVGGSVRADHDYFRFCVPGDFGWYFVFIEHEIATVYMTTKEIPYDKNDEAYVPVKHILCIIQPDSSIIILDKARKT